MLVYLTALLIASTPAPTEALDWQTIVTRVESTSPLMQAAHAGLERFEAALKSATWSHFPVFEINARAGLVPEAGALDPSASLEARRWGDYYRVGVLIEQPIYSFGKIAGLKSAARHGVESATAHLEVARWELRYRAARAYQGALMAREIEGILSEGARWIEKVHKRLDTLRTSDSEDYDPLVHLRLKSRFGELAQMQSDNQALFNESHDALRLLLSRPANRPVRPDAERVSVVPFTLKSAEEYLAIAAQRRPDLKAAEAAVLTQGALSDSAKAQVLPDLVLVGEFNALGSETLERPLALPNEGSVGMAAGVLLALRWRFDARQSLHRASEHDALARQLRARAQDAEQTMEAEVRRLHGRLRGQIAVVDATRESMVASQSWLANAWELYDTGFGKLDEVMDALERFWATRLAHLESMVTHNLLVVELSRAVGHDIAAPQDALP